MTPWQFRECIQASIEEALDKHDHKAWFIWHLAALFRAKKLPDHKLFYAKRDKLETGEKKAVPGINEDAIMAWLQAADAKSKAKKGNKTP